MCEDTIYFTKTLKNEQCKFNVSLFVFWFLTYKFTLARTSMCSYVSSDPTALTVRYFSDFFHEFKSPSSFDDEFKSFVLKSFLPRYGANWSKSGYFTSVLVFVF